MRQKLRRLRAVMQALCSDTCLAMLRTSKDWLAARTVSSTSTMFQNDVESTYNRLVVQACRLPWLAFPTLPPLLFGSSWCFPDLPFLMLPSCIWAFLIWPFLIWPCLIWLFLFWPSRVGLPYVVPLI